MEMYDDMAYNAIMLFAIFYLLHNSLRVEKWYYRDSGPVPLLSNVR